MADEIFNTGNSRPLVGYLATVESIRQVGKEIRRVKGGFTSEQALAFLDLYADEIKDRLAQTMKDFLKEKL